MDQRTWGDTSGHLPIAHAVQHLNEESKRDLWCCRVFSENCITDSFHHLCTKLYLSRTRAATMSGLSTHAVIKTDSSTEGLQARFMTRQHTDAVQKHRGREERR